MMRDERLPFTQWADIHRTDQLTSVEPLSGYGMVQRDNEGYVIYLASDASDEALGQALLEALDRSRFIWPPDEMEFFEAERYVRCYKNWQKDFIRRLGCKTKRELYKTMDWCRAERCEGTISIQPHRRGSKPEYFTYLPADKNIVIPLTTDPVVLGTAVRLAFDRCK
jgi:hypothetical protein